MPLTMTTLRPGLLVNVKTSITGNVNYTTETTEPDHPEGDARVAAWNTRRVVKDAQEQEAATKLRSDCRYLIQRICANSSFGMLCPEDRSRELADAVDEARRLTNAFNATAKLTRVKFFVLTGRIADSDMEAMKAINSEVRELLDAMSAGVQALDVKAIRDAADRARDIGRMLSDDAQARIQNVVDAARTAATRIKKAGETAAVEVEEVTLRTIQRARTAFLDLEPGTEVIAPKADARAVDFDPADAPSTVPAAPSFTVQYEL